MSRVMTVVRKEYLERVRSKSFLIGTLVGLLILRVINNGIIILRWNQDLQIVISGLIIILAVYIDNKRKVARSKIITT